MAAQCSLCFFRNLLGDGSGNFQCRRNAPVAISPEGDPMANWPTVLPTFWCGEFSADDPNVYGPLTGLGSINQNEIVYASAANLLTGLPSAGGGIYNTDPTGLPSITRTPVLGIPGVAAGILGLVDATTSGVVSLASAPGTASYTLEMPPTAGTPGQQLTAMGGGTTAFFTSGRQRYLNLANSQFGISLLDLSNDLIISAINFSNTSTTSLDVHGCTALTALICESTPNFTTYNITGCAALTKILFDSNGLTGALNLDGVTSLTAIQVTNNSITSANFTGNNSLASINLAVCALTSCVIGAGPVKYCNVQSNALPQAQIDAILAALDLNGLATGTAVLNLGTNATPSAAGLVSKANLVAKAWTVSNNLGGL